MCPWVITMVRALGLKWGAGEAYVEIGGFASMQLRRGLKANAQGTSSTRAGLLVSDATVVESGMMAAADGR
jgi:hypothetical protein